MKIALICCFALLLATIAAQNPPCNPGDVKQEDCNTCRCVKGGLWACTKKRCLHKRAEDTCQDGENCAPKPNGSDVNTFSCIPGQTFKKECNSCRCTPDGKNAICTLKACNKVLN